MTNAQSPTIAVSPTQDFRWNWMDASFAAGLVGLSPLLYEHAQNLWRKPHFQFFPIAWLLFAYLVYSRGRIAPTASPFRRGIAIAIALLSIAVGGVSVIWFSPWLAHVAMALVCAAWMYGRLGGNAWHVPIAWLSLLVVSLPMPLNLDQRLIQSLQSRSARSASSLLDVFGISHLPTGNVIEIQSGKLFVDEACSGVDSLYALAAVALGLVIWNQRNFVQSLIVLMTVPVWAWLGNTIRILAIAMLLDQFDMDLTHGLPHSILGMITFSLSCACLLVTQSLLTTLLTPFPFKSITAGPFHELFNSVVTFPRNEFSVGKKKNAPSTGESVPPLLSRKSIGIMHCAVWGLLGAGAALPVMGIGPWKRESIKTPVISQAAVEQTFVASSLPSTVADMRQVAFQTVHRERDDTNGAHSATWQFIDGEQRVQVSVDFPFVGFHALEVCYLLTGCSLMTPVESIDLERKGSPSELVINEIRFVNALSDECYSCYTAFDRDGRPVSGTESRFSRGVPTENAPRVSYQAQLFIEGCGKLSDEQRSRYRQILGEVCELLLPTIKTLPE
jgi:exosortase